MKYMIAFLLFVALFLVACSGVQEKLPPGDYVAYPGTIPATPVATIDYAGYHVDVFSDAPEWPTGDDSFSTSNPSQTPWIITATPIVPTQTAIPTNVLDLPTSESNQDTPSTGDNGSKVCQIRALNSSHAVRNNHSISATQIAWLERLYYANVKTVFVYQDVTNEWYYVIFKNSVNQTIVGWIKRDDDVEFGAADTLSICLDVSLTQTVYDSTVTPAPTATLAPATPINTTPTATECTAVNRNAYNINIRADWSGSGTILGAFVPGGRAVIGWFYNGFAYITYKGLYGWVKLGSELVTTEGNCSKIPVTQPKVEVPSPPKPTGLRAGLHVLFGGGAANVVAYASKYQVIKCLTGSELICLQAKEKNPSLILVYRSLHTCRGMTDGPALDQWDGVVWYNCVKPYWPAGFDYYEYVNEIAPPGDDYGLFAQFSIQFAAAAAADGRCTLAFSFPPGNPDLRYWGDLYPYFQWANTHPCSGSRYPGLAFHQPAYLPFGTILRNGSWINNDWVAGRDILADNLLQQTKGFSFNDFKGFILVSEMGLSDGYSGSWDDRWSCGDVRLAYWTTITEYRTRHPWIDGFAWWTCGTGGSKWTDDSNCLQNIYQS